jgi:hypothetical protein
MKYLKMTAIILALGAPVYFGLKLFTNTPEQQTTWQTFEKVDKKISSHNSTPEEKKKSRVGTTKRAPASKAPLKAPAPPTTRFMSGTLGKKYQNKPWKLNYVNSPSTEWKNLYSNKILSILPEGTKLLIKKTRGLVVITPKGAKYIEHVRVSIQKKDSPPVGFEAQVDSETGEQLRVWNRTEFEYGQSFTFEKKL